MRRSDGARVNLSKRMKLVSVAGTELEGGVLNVSRGGIRIILEDSLGVGDVFAVHVGDPDDADAFVRPGRVVWVQQEPDGVIAGLEFTDRTSSASIPAARVASQFPPDDEGGG